MHFIVLCDAWAELLDRNAVILCDHVADKNTEQVLQAIRKSLVDHLLPPFPHRQTTALDKVGNAALQRGSRIREKFGMVDEIKPCFWKVLHIRSGLWRKSISAKIPAVIGTDAVAYASVIAAD